MIANAVKAVKNVLGLKNTTDEPEGYCVAVWVEKEPETRAMTLSDGTVTHVTGNGIETIVVASGLDEKKAEEMAGYLDRHRKIDRVDVWENTSIPSYTVHYDDMNRMNKHRPLYYLTRRKFDLE